MSQASKLSSLLSRDGVIDVKRMEQAFQRQVIYGGALDTILLETGEITEERLLPYLSMACGLPPVDKALLEALGKGELDSRVHKLCSEALAARYHVVPIGFDGEALRVLVADPVDLARLEELATELRTAVQPYVAPEYRFFVTREQVYGSATPSRFASLASKQDANLAKRASQKRAASEAPATREPAKEQEPEPSPLVSAEVRVDPTPLPATEASAALAEARGRDEVFMLLLRAARSHAWYAGLLVVRQGIATGRLAIEGRRVETEEITRVRIALDAPTAFGTTVESSAPYIGPVATGHEATDDVLRLMGGVVPPSALILPVSIRGRIVALVYAHRGADALEIADVSLLLPLAADAGLALSRVIVRGKTAGGSAVVEAQTGTEGAGESVGAGDRESESAGERESESAGAGAGERERESESAGEGDSQRASEAELLDELESDDEGAAQRAQAEAARRAGALTGAIEERFPGRIVLDRHRAPTGNVRAAHYGPLLGFLAQTGGPFVPLLTSETRSGIRDNRFYAAVALGEIRDPASLPALVGLLFDSDYGVRGVALEGLVEFPPRLLDAALEPVRHALLEPPPRSRAAAHALGELRDVKSVPLLLDALVLDDSTRDEAHRALVQITKQDFGRKYKKWSSWWQQNQDNPRVSWMIDGLAHGDAKVRYSAIEELRQLTGETFGYRHEAPKRERERARKAWNAWWDETGSARYA